MAYIVMAMAYVVMVRTARRRSCIVMADVAMAYIGMAYIVTACIATAYLAMAYVVMSYGAHGLASAQSHSPKSERSARHVCVLTVPSAHAHFR